MTVYIGTAQKMKFSIKDFFIFCAVRLLLKKYWKSYHFLQRYPIHYPIAFMLILEL